MTRKELAFNRRNSFLDSGGKQLRMNTDVDKFATHLPDSTRVKQILETNLTTQLPSEPSFAFRSNSKFQGFPELVPAFLSPTRYHHTPKYLSLTIGIPFTQVLSTPNAFAVSIFSPKMLSSPTPPWEMVSNSASQPPLWNIRKGKAFSIPSVLLYILSIHPREHFSQASVFAYLQTIFYISDSFFTG